MAGITIRRGLSRSLDPIEAARELSSAIHHPDAALTLFYCSPSYDLDALGAALAAEFGGAPLVGCTTAGEITPEGYLSGALVGVSIGGVGFRASSVLVPGLDRLELGSASQAAREALGKILSEGGGTSDCFAFVLADGLSGQEEALISALYRSLPSVPLFGGSAGDGTRFERTCVYFDGRFRERAAVLTVVRSPQPFKVFKTEHFVPSPEKMVVTGADPARRIVTEINGEPAGPEYARVVGLEVSELTPLVFASHPVCVRVGGTIYIRSIQKVNEDGSLTFFCAIDEGIVLTVARGESLVGNLASAFRSVRSELGPPELVLGFDCILRSIEADQLGVKGEIGELMRENNVVGFATYGEQFNAMHVNQTFTGVAIGAGHAR